MENDSMKQLMNNIAEKAKEGRYSDHELLIGQLMVISKALVEIRDELRIMNERSGNYGNT